MGRGSTMLETNPEVVLCGGLLLAGEFLPEE